MADEKTSKFARELNTRLTQIREWLEEQQWFQELRAKWDELDPQSQVYLKWAGLGLSVFLAFTFLGGLISGVGETEEKFRSKSELVRLLNKANRKKSGGRKAIAPPANWQTYIKNLGNTAAIPGDKFIVRPGKIEEIGTARENMIAVDINRVNIRQLTNYIFQLETGSQPVKIRNLDIQTVGNDGWLNAKLAVSAFEVKAEDK